METCPPPVRPSRSTRFSWSPEFSRMVSTRVRSPRRLLPAAFLLGLLASAIPAPATPVVAAANPIVIENQQPGSSAWQLTKAGDDVNGQIKGYGSATSVLQGGNLTLYVTVNPAEAYNDYPNDKLTGKSLYEYNSYGANTMAGTRRAVKVSFDRPFAGNGSGLVFSWDIQLIRWLERNGYDVTYSTDVDTHANGGDLLNHKAFFSAGHDEYWSNQMYNAAQNARDAGVNLAFFGANDVYWQVRYEASAAGVANRVLVCYKSASIDPVQGPTTTVLWRSAPVNRPEQALMGIQYTSEVSYGSNVPYVVTNSSHWVYAGTCFHDGDTVPGIVGYEMYRDMSNYPAPNTTNRTLLSHSPYTDTSGLADYASSSIYQAPSGAWVFAAGTMSWSWGLDNYSTGIQPDARIQQTTANLLNAFLFGAPTLHALKLTAPASAITGQPFTVSVTAENARGNPVTSYSGTVHFSSSDTSSGVVLPPDSTLTTGQGTFSARP